MVTYQFEVDDELWETWTESVPRTIAPDERLTELIEADLEGRVLDELEDVDVSMPQRAAADLRTYPRDEDKDYTPDSPDVPSEVEAEVEGSVEDHVQEAVVAATGTWEDSEERLETRREAAATVLEHALRTDEAVGQNSPIVEEVMAEYPVDGHVKEMYWRRNLRPVLDEFGTYDLESHGYEVDDLVPVK